MLADATLFILVQVSVYLKSLSVVLFHDTIPHKECSELLFNRSPSQYKNGLSSYAATS